MESSPVLALNMHFTWILPHIQLIIRDPSSVFDNNFILFSQCSLHTKLWSILCLDPIELGVFICASLNLHLTMIQAT